MADAGLHGVALAVGPQARAEVMRRRRLANRADVVLLALDREQRGALNRARLDLLAAPLERACRELVLLEKKLWKK